MLRFVIHIGPHKTGTTYLQACFSALRQQLESSGVFYSTDWQADRGPGHADLARRIRRGPDTALENEFSALGASARNTVLISAEDLSKLPPAEISYLKTLVGERPVEIVFYIRRPAELLFSVWQESIKHGNVKPLPTFIAEHFIDVYASEIVNPTIILDRYAEVFGVDSIRIVCYNTLEQDKLDIFEHFLATFLGLSGMAAPKIARQNPSMTAVEAEIWRTLNIVRRDAGLPGRVPPREFAWGRKMLDFASIGQAMERTKAALIIDDANPMLRNITHRILTKYERSIVEPRIPNWLFPRKRTAVNFIQQDFLLAEQNLKEITRICGAFVEHQEAAR